jgi:hypothetical protein
MLGLDCLGLAKFGKEAIQAFPHKGFALGVFSRQFGDAKPHTNDLLARCSALRVQLIWSDGHSFSDADIPTLKTEAKRWDDLGKKLPVYLSPFCEHRLAEPDKYLEIVQKAAPNCTPVNSLESGASSGNFINEVHGVKKEPPPGSYIFSYDGSEILDSNVEAIKQKHANALIWFGWTANFNGHAEAKAKGSKNETHVWPTAKLMKSVIYVMQHPKGGTQLPKNWGWRARDPQTNKPVLISPVKAASAELVNALGHPIVKAPYKAVSGSGRHRYDFPEWGFESAAKAGGIPVDLRVGGKVYGKINPAFCDGDFK